MSAYVFTDTTEASPAVARPAEAVCFNGIWLDDEIAGFRTLNVQGRELADREADTYETGSEVGEEFRRAYYKPRTITVTYQIKAATDAKFREYYEQLNRYLEAKQARLIFNDEVDKYFIATKTSNNEVDAGMNSVTGTIEFLCADPCKYSTVEQTFDAAANSEGILEAAITNDGTMPASVSYEITHNHENGFIGIVSEYGAIQLGSPDEVDAVPKQRSEELFRYDSPADYNAMTNGQGILTEDFPKNGTWGSVSAEGKQWLSLSGQGSGSSWHGASKYQVLPADTQGGAEAVNFYCQAKVWYETGLVEQTGLVELVIGDEDGDHLASIHLIKKVTNANTAEAVFQVMGVEKGRVSFTPSNQGPTTKDGGQIYIRKTGQQFDFYFGGTVYPFRVPEAAEKKAHSVTIFLGQIGSGGSLITRMYFDYLFFRKDNVTYLSDIPNRYQAGDVVFIDGGKQKVYTNGIPTQDEVVGSKYFKVPSGTTTVQFYYSDFCSPPPAVQARIREVYL